MMKRLAEYNRYSFKPFTVLEKLIERGKKFFLLFFSFIPEVTIIRSEKPPLPTSPCYALIALQGFCGLAQFAHNGFGIGAERIINLKTK